MEVVTAHEMAKIELLAYEKGFLEKDFMQNAGTNVAKVVQRYVKKYDLCKKVTLLVGKGNNGGDGYVAGIYLLAQGFEVVAFALYDIEDSSPLNRHFCEEFQKKGGNVHFVQEIDDLHFFEKGVLLDGILGTGFKGKLDDFLHQVIETANKCRLLRISIDIPSGLNGNTGEISSTAIKADVTAYLGLAKMGFFLKEGYNHVGLLEHVDFGLTQEFIQKGKIEATLCEEKHLTFPKIVRTQHKYQAGYVVAIAGSKGMGGAAKLCALASLRSGAGIVRLFHPQDMEEEMRDIAHEIIQISYSPHDIEVIQKELKRAQAVCIGPGIGKDIDTSFFESLFASINIACVFDADALYFLAHNLEVKWPENCIITPHKKEMLRLLGKEKTENLLQECQTFAEKKNCIIVLKGAPTFILKPITKPMIVNRGDPGMATAGTGDVLTGVIAAFLAHGLDPYDAAVLGVYLHGVAGEIAAEEKTSMSLIASDLLEQLPKAFKQLLNATHKTL